MDKDTQFSRVLKAAAAGHTPHFFLFYGGSSEMRRAAFLRLASLLNCSAAESEKPCGVCAPCHRIAAGSHPDVYIVTAAKASLGIDQIKSLRTSLSRQRYEGNYSVALLEDADKLTQEAGNALLRLTEEPPEGTILVAATANPDTLLPTLQSRAQKVYFAEAESEGSPADILAGGDAELAEALQAAGVDIIRGLLDAYDKVLSEQNFLLFFPLAESLNERETARLFLLALAVRMREGVGTGRLAPQMIESISQALADLRRQANPRLVLEVMVLKQLQLASRRIP
jgi:DNA polymerase-3 subunit delta'